MFDASRVATRLRRGALRGYEFALYAMLLALAAGVLLALPGEEEEPAYCGKAQSRAVVMSR